MPDTSNNANPLPLSVLREGAEKSFANAEQLFKEAELLAAAGATARGLCLHQISLEECAKVDRLGAWAVSEVLGFAVDRGTVLKALSRHASKNRSNAYMLEVTEEELDARAIGDLAAANAAFRAVQDRFHAASNDAKNAALYVDWSEDGFVAPNERITLEMLAEIAARNADFLGYAFNHVKTLRWLEAQSGPLTELLNHFATKVRKLGEEPPEKRIEAMAALLADFLETGKERFAGQPAPDRAEP